MEVMALERGLKVLLKLQAMRKTLVSDDNKMKVIMSDVMNLFLIKEGG